MVKTKSPISLRSFQGGLEHSRCRGILSPAYTVLRRTADFDDGYFRHLLKSHPVVSSLNVLTTGIRQGKNISYKDFAGFSCPLPPLVEQCAIAGFLDQEAGKIDALVGKKVRLIELLQEKRTARITRAVTKGLNPNVPMKESGTEWLGEIPAHWDIRAVWTLFGLGRGRVISHEEIHENPGPYPVYSSQTENDGVMGHLATYDFDGEYLTWTTDGARAGTVFARQGKFNCTNVCGTLRAGDPSSTDLRFTCRALNIATAWFVRHDINPKLMNNVMARIRVPVPTYEEQQAIADYLDTHEKKINELSSKINDGINRLKQFRTALISAAVTGKIDVREKAE